MGLSCLLTDATEHDQGLFVPSLAIQTESHTPGGLLGVIAAGVALGEQTIDALRGGEIVLSLGSLGGLPQGVVGQFVVGIAPREIDVGIDGLQVLIATDLQARQSIER